VRMLAIRSAHCRLRGRSRSGDHQMVEEISGAGVLPKRPDRGQHRRRSGDALPRQGLSSIDGRAATP
jgi:hypothetical protein